jgi:hypothetical protein
MSVSPWGEELPKDFTTLFDDTLYKLDTSLIPEAAGAYSLPLLSSTLAVLVTPPRVPLSNRLAESHAPNVSHKICLR